MDDPRNRPRVFLSHSKADIDFIQSVLTDLRGCQIDPWLDSLEIRHGQPWLDAIFESGIPTCDCVLVYLTERSIESSMVKKEIDAGIIRKLKDKKVAFLPYISDGSLRDKLRMDLQALQVPEWNANNYHEMLPRVVAEIWHSYLDRTIFAATNEEKVKRLDAELELVKMKNAAGERIFSEGENKDFAYIHKALDRWETVVFSIPSSADDNQTGVVQERSYRVNVLMMVLLLVRDDNAFSNGRADALLIELLQKEIPAVGNLKGFPSEFVRRKPTLDDELRMYGLIQEQQHIAQYPRSGSEGIIPYQQVSYQMMFTDKMQRLRYWLAVNKLMPKEDRLKTEKPLERPLSRTTPRKGRRS